MNKLERVGKLYLKVWRSSAKTFGFDKNSVFTYSADSYIDRWNSTGGVSVGQHRAHVHNKDNESYCNNEQELHNT